MQLLLTMLPQKPLIIPLHYQYQLQSAIYSLLGEVGQSDFWHDNGFGNATNFKGFCFGKLTGDYTIDAEKHLIRFEDQVYLEVRSATFSFIDSFQRAIEHRPFLTLFDTRLDIVGASLSNQHFTNGHVILKAVTPVVIRQTTTDGHSYFFSPEEEEYFIRICNNAEKKYEAVTGELAENILLRPKGEFKKTVTKYKGFWITGHTGLFELNTSLKMAEFLYNSGLGEKNTQGFGFVNVLNRYEYN